ncbi:MAG TPA: hypothetical protein PLU67_07270 [Candidatus Kapabacteria bacterium]|nr:hypothetical protein [Candidatus Kapabacteria bacterium]HOM05276.1 hypothetical protein [Candidatus Kapabacteria bacterium]HPP38693.1 hypothetical protein [Candidatus Kapabacteria bacterium]
MGLISKEELTKNQVKWVSIDQESGEFELDNHTYPAISGRLLGFGKHAYSFRNQTQEKFDIFIGDDAVYQLQFGYHSWTTWRLLNQLISQIDSINGHNNILLRAGKDKDGNFYIFAILDGKPLKWKYKYAEIFKDAKEKDKIETMRNKCIEKWASVLIEKKNYTPDITLQQQQQTEEEEWL